MLVVGRWPEFLITVPSIGHFVYRHDDWLPPRRGDVREGWGKRGKERERGREREHTSVLKGLRRITHSSTISYWPHSQPYSKWKKGTFKGMNKYQEVRFSCRASRRLLTLPPKLSNLILRSPAVGTVCCLLFNVDLLRPKGPVSRQGLPAFVY